MPVNYKEISTTGGRDIKEKYLTRIDAALRDLPVQQRAIIEAQIIEESGGDPMAKSANGTYQGLLQWGKDRYKIKSKDPYVELDNQIKYLRQSIGAITDGKSWTHGGKGSGYKSSKEAYGIFNNPEASFDDSFRAFSYGYVRPYGKEASYNNRLKVGHQVYDRILQSETEPAVYSDPLTALPDATLVVKPIVPIPTQEPIDLHLLHTKAEGGHLDIPTPWNELPISQRAEIMREAVNNGIYNLQDVRDAYHNNLFAGGGYMPSKAIKQRIAEWEGSSMYKAAPDTGKVNRSFEAEARDFNRVIPASIRTKLSQEQLDALYSYGYNVGMGNLKKRVLPTLTNYINGSAGAEDVASSMWASRDSDPKMGGLRRRRDYERSQFVYGSPAERRQSVVTSALDMDLSNLPSGPSEEDLQQLYLANPTDYGTPVDYSTPTRPVVESPVEEDYTQANGMGIWSLMSSMGMFGDTTKQEAPLATYTPAKSSNPYVASIPTYNDTMLDASWFGDGGPIDLGYNSKAYEEWKASLPKNLRKETPEYDLYGAYRAGLQPHLEADGYYHLGSRDPKTNRLLKKPSHPTYPLAILADAQEGYLASPYDKKTDSVYTYPLPWIKGNGGYLYDDGGYTLTDKDSGNTYYGVDDVVNTDQLRVNPDGSVTTVNGVTGAVVLPEATVTGYQNEKDRMRAVLDGLVKERPAQITSIPSIALTAAGDLIKGGANALVNAFGLPDVAPASDPREIKDGDALLDYASVVTPAAKASIFRPLTFTGGKNSHLYNIGATKGAAPSRPPLMGLTEIPLDIRAEAANKYTAFINSKDYLNRLKDAGLEDHWEYMKALTNRRVQSADYFPSKVEAIINNKPNVTGRAVVEPSSPHYGITLQESLPSEDVYPSLYHEISHWATGNAETNDLANSLRYPFKYDPNYKNIGDIMRYNESIAPPVEWDDILKTFPGSTPIDELTRKAELYDYLTDPQEIRARLYNIYQQAKDNNMSVDAFVDNFIQDGKIIEDAPINLQQLGDVFTIDNLKKRLNKFLAIAPIGIATASANSSSNKH